MEIGSHGCAHRYLPLLGADESRHEIAASRSLISAVLGAPVTSYAPVGGHYTARDVKHIWEAGYSTFATMEPGVSRGAAGAASLCRNHLLADDSPSRIGRIVKAWPPTLFYNRLRYLGLLLPKKILGLRGYDRLKGILLSKLSRGDGGPKR
jgi:peptidoglycan/xylan/chitin deacetylase (PgdA/CDA1 family)